MDFIETFCAWTESVPSPPQFKLWAGISTLAGACERRIWAKVYTRPTFANMFIALVATPGIGKGVIEETAHLWRTVPRGPGEKRPILHLAPDSTTAASMLMALKDAHRIIIKDGRLLDEYHCLQVPAEEMAVFLPSHDLEFLGRLNYIFNNPPFIRVLRVYQKDLIEIINPQLNILAGAQPGYLASLLPEEAWSMGFASRLIMIHAGEVQRVELFAADPHRADLERQLLEHLRVVCGLRGQMQWEPKAAQALVNWEAGGMKPRPDHSRLVYYNNRRLQYVVKLAIVSALSYGFELVIRHVDIVRALDWLLPAEERMPDIFREMVHRSDSQVMQELHFYMMKEWLRTKKSLPGARLRMFLLNRISSDKIERLLDVMLRANMVSREVATDVWTPRAQSEFGME